MDNLKEDIYDINKYTDRELFGILDLNEPTDGELEAKIISLYNRYQNMQNSSGNQLAKFFKDIYERFFEIPGDEEEYTNIEDSEKEGITTTLEEGFDTIIEGVENMQDQTETNPPSDTKPSADTKKQDTSVSFTTQLPYAQDKLNPLLTQTIKRIVSIDSQYRDDKTALSTDYTFNLSESLKDVVAIKLYSIQIPHTWYTVSTNYGCNFFYIKGSSPGINDGNFDYKIDISAGNYTAGNLITTMNDSLKKVATLNPDISFGNTSINYNPNTALATFTIDMKKQYNESSYYLYFPTWSYSVTNEVSTDPILNPRFQTLPGFLGFNYDKYFTDLIYSQPILPLTTDIYGQRADTLKSIYHIDNSNNYFTIIKYIGPQEYDPSSCIVDLSFNITLSNLTGLVTRSQIIAELNYQLANNDYLVDSEISRLDITDMSKNGYGNSFYELNIKFDRNTTNNISNSKTLIIFPTETLTTAYNNIWTGTTSCLAFQYTHNELNNIISEVSTVEQQSGKYKITSNPYIHLKCINPSYSVDENSYTITLANSTGAGYTLSQYVTAINSAMLQTNQTTITTKNTQGDFNMKNQQAYVDDKSIFNIQFDLNRNFTQDMYYLDLSNSILNSIFNLSGGHLTGTPILTGSKLYDSQSNEYNFLNKVDTSYTFMRDDQLYTFDDSYNIIFNNINDRKHNSKDEENIKKPNYYEFFDNVDKKTYVFRIGSPFDLTTSTLTDPSGYRYTYVDSSYGTDEITSSFINYDFREPDGKRFGYLDSIGGFTNYIDNFLFPFMDSNGNIIKLSNLSNIGYDYSDISGSDYIFHSNFEDMTQYYVDASYVLTANPSKLNYGNQAESPFQILTNTLQPIYYNYQSLETDINQLLNNYTDRAGTKIFSGSRINIVPNEVTRTLDCTFIISMKKTLTQLDYKVEFYDSLYYDQKTKSYNKFLSSWYNNLNINENLLLTNEGTGGQPLVNYDKGLTSWTTITGTLPIPVNTISFIDNKNNIFYMVPYEKGVSSLKGENNIMFKIPAIAADKVTQIKYTRDTLITTLNKLISSNPVSKGSVIKLITINQLQYTEFRVNINKIYTAQDYNLVFYDQISFSSCYSGVTSITNTTWDTTLGWLIGFQNSTIYQLSNYGAPGQTIILTGNTTVSVNLYNYFLLCLDDYTQNHLNDGLVTLSTNNASISLPSYANKANYSCDPVTGLLTYNASKSDSFNKLTQKQLYSITEIANSKRQSTIISSSPNVNAKSYGSGPFVKDVFGYLPIKPGVDNGSVCVWDGGTLQNQDRGYFGPVNISKMAVKLVSDRGDTINLNGSNWSFSLVVEQLYQQKPTASKST
jgi:hypothetical protein